jgi:hypothetical protein
LVVRRIDNEDKDDDEHDGRLSLAGAGSRHRQHFRFRKHSSEKGSEYEGEFEDEDDSGTIETSERLFFLSFAICWYQSTGRVLMIAPCASRRISPLANPQIV